MSKNNNAYGSRKRPFSETINNLKSWYRKVRYRIVDAPSFCKDLFSLKCNQLTMRDCALKNFAIWYIEINNKNAEQLYNEALASGDSAKAKKWGIVADVMAAYVEELEKAKQFLVKKEGMSDEKVAEAAERHPSLMRKDKND